MIAMAYGKCLALTSISSYKRVGEASIGVVSGTAFHLSRLASRIWLFCFWHWMIVIHTHKGVSLHQRFWHESHSIEHGAAHDSSETDRCGISMGSSQLEWLSSGMKLAFPPWVGLWSHLLPFPRTALRPGRALSSSWWGCDGWFYLPTWWAMGCQDF